MAQASALDNVRILRDEAEIFRSATTVPEPDLKAIIANHVLQRFPNVFITPHNAYNTTEAVGRSIGTTVEDVEAFARPAAQYGVLR